MSELSAVDRGCLEALRLSFAEGDNQDAVRQIDALLSGAKRPLSFKSLAGFQSAQMRRKWARRSVT